jgi:dissimilatory sulfite reductase (desulfoviridin) alpha/beta subunit
MEKNEKIYIDLRRHINSQAIGFPATKTGSELRILKHIFSPKEAEKGIGREITLGESLSILDENQKQGLVLQPSNTEQAEFICSCCGCCCGMLSMHKGLPKPVDFWASNYFAVVETDVCNGCGNCEKRCQVGAARVSEQKKKTSVDLNRCIGCGLCIPTCPQKAMSLKKKPNEVRPPQTRDDLYDIIMSHKKGSFGKLKIKGKIVIDAIRTGQTHLLR